MTGLSAIPYFGGKAPRGPRKTGDWILGLLPPVEPGQCYIEPFAGMLGILLNRPPARIEIVNDLSDAIVTWWLAVRDYPSELVAALDATPHARVEFERAVASWDDVDAGIVERARRITVVLAQCMHHSMSAGSADWMVSSVRQAPHLWRLAERIPALSQRLSHVTIECRDAVNIIQRFAAKPHVVMYLDPPYQGKDGRYDLGPLDVGALTDVLRSAEARILISGYAEDWDHLGWERADRASFSSLDRSGDSDTTRREFAWSNYSSSLRLF